MLPIVEQAIENEAYAIALEAYVYGYPRVELARRIHNETQRVTIDQLIYAPPNAFFYFSRLARPGDGLVIKAANHDTLYASAYLDLMREPVVLRVPRMENRLYVALIVDAAGAVVQRLNRGYSGPGGVDHVFVGPDNRDSLPSELRPIQVSGNDLWLLMRVATDGTQADEAEAARLLKRFRLEGLSNRATLDQPQVEYPVQQAPLLEPSAPMDQMDFFHKLARMLARNPVPAKDVGLLERWGRIHLQANRFDEAKLSQPARRGVLRAIHDAEQIVSAAQFGIANTVNGWNYSLVIGRTGNDWALNAAIARGGYGNLPEDSVYYQRTLDAEGAPLSGSHAYRLTFPTGSLPPVGAFWSITAYDVATFDFFENEVQRYAIGDRTPGLTANPDGSLTIAIQQRAPEEPLLRRNWLPVGNRTYYLIIRTYDPSLDILEGRWSPPELTRAPE